MPLINEVTRVKELLLQNPNIPDDTAIEIKVWTEDSQPPLLNRQFNTGETWQWMDKSQTWFRDSKWWDTQWVFILQSKLNGDKYYHSGVLYYVPTLLRLP